MKKFMTRTVAALLGVAIITQSAFLSPVTAFAAEDESAIFASTEIADADTAAEDISISDASADTEASDESVSEDAAATEDISSEDASTDIGSEDISSEDAGSEEASIEASEESSEDASSEASSEDEIPVEEVVENKRPVGAAANQIGDNVTYTVSGTTIRISGTGTTYDYAGYTDSPLSQYNKMTEIIVEEGVTSLGNYLLSRVNNYGTSGSLKKLTLPSTLESIGDACFNSFDGKNVDLVIPGSVKHLGKRAFEGTFKSITLSEGITEIQEKAFWNTKVTKFVLPESLSVIGESAFGMFHYSDDLIIPKNVKTIGPKAFEDLDIMTRKGTFTGNMPVDFADNAFEESLMVMTYPANNSTWSDAAVKALSDRVKNVNFVKSGTAQNTKCGENITWSINGSTLKLTGSGPMYDYDDNNQVPWSASAGKITALSLDNKITTIADYSFYGMKLSSVTLPSSLTKIGQGAFEKSTLKSAKLPSGVTYYGSRAFYDCYDLALTGTFNANITYIGDEAFDYCSDMTVTLPKLNCIEYIGKRAFEFTRKMKVSSLQFPETLTYIGDSAFWDSFTTTATLTLPSSLEYVGRSAFSGRTGLKGELVIPEGIGKIEYGAFSECGFTSVTINSAEIGESSFTRCPNLTKVVIGPNLKIIPQRAFYECAKLSDVEGMAGLERINYQAFCGCKAIKSITFGEKALRLDSNIFDGTSLSTLTFTGEKPTASYAGTWRGIPDGPTVRYPRNRASWFGVTAKSIGMTDLNPKFEPYGPELMCTVTYKLGKEADAKVYKTETVAGGTNLTQPENPADSEYQRFKRWMNADTGREYNFSDIVKGDLTLYADWDYTYFRVTFVYYVDGSCHSSYTSYPYGSKPKVPNLVSYGYKEDKYKIEGWSLTRDKDTGELGEIVDPSKHVVTGEVSFYANVTSIKDTKPGDEEPENPTPAEPEDPTPVDPTPVDPKPGDEPEEPAPVEKEEEIRVEINGEPTYNNGKTCIPWGIYVYDGDERLEKDKDYTLKFLNATKAGTGTVVVTFKGNYSGTIRKDYTISPMPISSREFTIYPLMYSYNGKNQSGTPQVIWNVDGKTVTLKAGRDYTVSYQEEERKEPGQYIVFISGKGNFTGFTATAMLIEDAVNFSKVTISGVKNMAYTGDEVTQTGYTVKYGKQVLTEGIDYIVDYMNNTEVGTATAVFYAGDAFGALPEKEAGAVKFIGYKMVNFKITGTPISKAKVEGVSDSEIYTGSYITKNAMKLTYSASKGDEGRVLNGTSRRFYDSLNDKSQKMEYDYTYEYVNNVNKGTAKIIFRGVNGFTGSMTKSFAIKSRAVSLGDNYEVITPEEKKTKTIAVVLEKTMRYQKGGAKADITVYAYNSSDGYKELKSGKDYSVTYSNINKLGTAGFTVTGKGNFSGKISGTYEIVAGSSEDFVVTATDVVRKKTAGLNALKITIKDKSGKVLANNKDYSYKLVYAEDIAFERINPETKASEIYMQRAGEPVDVKNDQVPAGARIKVVVTPLGNYAGTEEKTAEFGVYEVGISAAKLTVGANSYDPKNSKLSYTLTYKGYPLEEGEDYVVTSVTGAGKAGVVKVTVRGIGYFGGTRVLSIKVGKRAATAAKTK